MKLQKFWLFLYALPVFIILTACADFNGIRDPLYDGKEVVPDEAAIETYHESGEVIGDEKDYYVRYPMSADIYNSSLAFPEAEPRLLEAGEYIVGEDLPAGRAILLSNESVFTRENTVVHVGNMTLYDEADEVYFENLFHTNYGQLTTQVDLIPGHRMEIIGTDTEITVFYEAELPENPYILMDPPELLVNLDRLAVQQPLTISEAGDQVEISAGIYEVGEHFEPSTYDITNVQAVHSTELFLFRAGEEPRVFELKNMGEDMAEDETEGAGNPQQIELRAGDKIYPSLVHTLQLTKVAE